MYKVVLVDDEEIIVNGLKKVIDWEKYNCQVVGTAFDVASGTKIICEVNPDILFTDIKMPDNDGLAMIAGLRSEFPNMQITILSGFNDFEYARYAMKLDVCRYLLKPSKISEISEALEEMIRKLSKNAVQNNTEEKSSLNDINSFIVRTAIDYIKENYSKKLTLTEVAENTHVSQWHLSKLLNKHAGKSFHDILNEIRIKKAKELLKDASLRISDISDMTGYADSAHFSKIFKKETGMSANTYRSSLNNL